MVSPGDPGDSLFRFQNVFPGGKRAGGCPVRSFSSASWGHCPGRLESGLGANSALPLGSASITQGLD